MKLLKLLNYELLFNPLSPQLPHTYTHTRRTLGFFLFINTPYIHYYLLCFVGHSQQFSHLNDKNNNNNSNSYNNNDSNNNSK